MPKEVTAPGAALPSRADLTSVQAPSSANLSASINGARPGPAPTRRSGGGALAIVGAAVASLAAVGAATWFLLIPAIEDSSDAGDETTGGAPLVIEDAANGPLAEGQTYTLMLPEQATGTSYQLVIDGEPIGAAQPTVPDLTATVGRQAVSVEIVGGGDIERTDTVDVIATPAAPEAGFRAHLARFSATAELWPAVIDAFDVLEAAGHTDLELLASAEVAGVSNGVWLVTVGGFTDGAAVEEYCERFGLSIPDQCYAAPVVPVGS
jgi:hypothetical protein